MSRPHRTLVTFCHLRPLLRKATWFMSLATSSASYNDMLPLVAAQIVTAVWSWAHLSLCLCTLSTAWCLCCETRDPILWSVNVQKNGSSIHGAAIKRMHKNEWMVYWLPNEFCPLLMQTWPSVGGFAAQEVSVLIQRPETRTTEMCTFFTAAVFLLYSSFPVVPSRPRRCSLPKECGTSPWAGDILFHKVFRPLANL